MLGFNPLGYLVLRHVDQSEARVVLGLQAQVLVGVGWIG